VSTLGTIESIVAVRVCGRAHIRLAVDAENLGNLNSLSAKAGLHF
jgi:hypothetical protein